MISGVRAPTVATTAPAKSAWSIPWIKTPASKPRFASLNGDSAFSEGFKRVQDHEYLASHPLELSLMVSERIALDFGRSCYEWPSRFLLSSKSNPTPTSDYEQAQDGTSVCPIHVFMIALHCGPGAFSGTSWRWAAGSLATASPVAGFCSSLAGFTTSVSS